MFARFPSAAFLLRPVPLLPTLTRILGERVFLGESYRPPVSGGRRDAGGMRLVSTLFVIIVKSQRKTKRQPTKRRPPHTHHPPFSFAHAARAAIFTSNRSLFKRIFFSFSFMNYQRPLLCFVFFFWIILYVVYLYSFLNI